MLYVNGDSNAAGAELLNSFAFAEDDPQFSELGRAPHPDNRLKSFGAVLAKKLGTDLVLDAESASSNQRIMRTSANFIGTAKDPVVVIGWSTWERVEWLIDDKLYQISGSGTDSVPETHTAQYKAWVMCQTTDEWEYKEQMWHRRIWEFHEELQQQNIKHMFFNSYSSFGSVNDQKDWEGSFFHPYSSEHTFYRYLLNAGFKTSTYHHSVQAHDQWANILLDNLQKL